MYCIKGNWPGQETHSFVNQSARDKSSTRALNINPMKTERFVLLLNQEGQDNLCK